MIEMTYLHWFIFAGGLLAIEVLSGTIYLLWCGLAAVLVGLITMVFPGISTNWTIALFGIFSIGCVIAIHEYKKRFPIITDQPLLNKRAQQYIGRTLTLDQPIVNKHGKVVIDDSNWKVFGPDCKAGTTIKVIGIRDSHILEVEIAS